MKTTRGTSIQLACDRGVKTALLSAPSAAESKKTVLVVDDHPVVRDMFACFLRGLGYGVFEAGGAGEAQQLAASCLRIDLLLTDFRMPQMNGLQLARWFHDSYPRAKVLVVSTAPWEVEPYFVQSDGFALLEKSQAFTRLAGIVNELLSQPESEPLESAPDAVSSRFSS